MSTLPFDLDQLLTGLLAAAGVGLLAWKAGALAPSGALGAALVGGIIFGIGGWGAAAILLAFFISSSLLSRLFDKRKADLVEKFEKGSRRDWAQVFANGGLGAFLILISPLFPGEAWPWLAFAGVIATANADTWATELGTLSRQQPRLISNGKRVPRGTSGGVTLWGTFISLVGAALIGLLAGWLGGHVTIWGALWRVGLAGLAGSLADSLLGATVQAIYRHPKSGKETERRPSPDSQPIRGMAGINNDVVNFLASLVGALVAALL